MRNLDEATITQAVLARNSGAADARLCEVMTSLVQHLHAFARDIKLTEKEWQTGIDFLDQMGAAGSSERREFVLLSHTLGLSTLVLAQNSKKLPGGTEPTNFDVVSAQQPIICDLGADITPGVAGPRCHVRGVVRDVKGNPVADATLQIGVSGTDAEALIQADRTGAYHFWTVLPDCQTIPEDGPVANLLGSLSRHACRPAHLQFTLVASGFRRLITQVFREGDRYLDSDAVFGVRSSLIAQWTRHEAGPTPAGTVSAEPFYSVNFDFALIKN